MTPQEDLIRHYQWLRRYGLNDSHSGNLSVRDGGGFWVTPTGACADLLEADALVHCPMDGKPAPGASLDAPLHAAVYRACADFQAVIHSHGPYTLAMTFAGTDFHPSDFEGQYYFPRVPVLNIAYGDYVEESPERVAAALREYPIVVVRGHGAYARGESINQAYKWTCSLELSARIAWLAQQTGRHPPGEKLL